jgi:hypothetical protein
MADHATLKAQNDAAYARAQAWVGRQDGWEQFHSENGITTWANKAERVAKIEGVVNKPPQVALAFIVGHSAELRQKYVKTAVSTEVVHVFEEDKSRVIREVNNYPTSGELVTYKYGVPRPQADGSFHIVVNSPEGVAEYPRSHSWLNFQLGIIAPHEGGSSITIYTHPETTLQLTEEQQNAVGLEMAHAFSGAAKDLNEAA